MQTEATTHNLELEMKFIDRIGKHSELDLDRKEILQRYKKALHKREKWCNMNKSKIIDYVQKSIEIEV